jgi:hypothetical protein
VLIDNCNFIINYVGLPFESSGIDKKMVERALSFASGITHFLNQQSEFRKWSDGPGLAMAIIPLKLLLHSVCKS